MNDEQQEAAWQFREALGLGREAGERDRREGRYDPESAGVRYREVMSIPAGLDLHVDFASARAGFLQGYRSLASDER